MTKRRAQQSLDLAGRQVNRSAGRRDIKITFGEMRASGIRGIIVDCADCGCGRWTAADADSWPDFVRLSDLESQLACPACGRGAVVRPDFAWQMRGRGGQHLNIRLPSVLVQGAPAPRGESAHAGSIAAPGSSLVASPY